MERTNENKRYNRYGRSWSIEIKFSNPLNRQLMITAKTLTETKPMNNTKKERISNDKKPNRICFFDLLRFIIITAFLMLLYHKFVSISSEIFGAAECEIIHSVKCEISHFVRCEMKFAPHICEANISPRSDFTWRSHISLAGGEFRWKKHTLSWLTNVCFFLVPVAGVEPAPCRQDWILSPARLPIPSHRRNKYYYSTYFLKCNT